MIEINLNDSVYVKLTDVGKAELEYQRNVHYSAVPHKEKLFPKPDEFGYTKWTLWDLMGTFGHLLTPGTDPPFEHNIKVERVKKVKLVAF